MRKTKLFYYWLMTYFLILALPLMVSFFVVSGIDRALRLQVEANNRSQLLQMANHVDSNLSELNQLYSSIALNPNVLQLLQRDRAQIPSFYFMLYELRRDMLALSARSQYISDFYIYFRKGSYVMTPQSFVHPQDMFLQQHAVGGGTFEEWLDLMRYTDVSGFTSLPFSGSRDRTVYIMPLRAGTFAPSTATLVMFVNTERLTNELSAVFDENFKVFVNDHIVIDLMPHIPHHGQAAAEAYSITSLSSGWVYIYDMIPDNSLYLPMSWIILLVCLLFGGIAAIWFSKMSYEPIKALLAGEDGSSLRYSEYMQIRNTIKRAEQKQAELEINITDRQDEFRSLLLWRLLTLASLKDEQVDQWREAFNLGRDLTYTLVLISVKQVTVMPQNHKTLQLIVSDCVHSTFETDNMNMITQIKDTFCCLLPIQIQSENELKSKLTKLRANIIHTYAMDCSVTASEQFADLKNVPRAYKNAMDMMLYCDLTENERVLLFTESSQPENLPPLKSNLESPLCHALKMGAKQEAQAYLRKIFSEYFLEEFTAPSLSRILFLNIFTILAKGIRDASVDGAESLLIRLSQLSGEDIALSTSEIMDELNVIIDETCRRVQESGSQKLKQLHTRMVDYVKHHYHDHELSIASIADDFSLSPTYVSNFFKEQHGGEGLLSFINKTRIEASCDLLANDGSIEQVAIQSGFASSNTFIKVFKKYMGVTPGAYRKSLKEENGDGALK